LDPVKLGFIGCGGNARWHMRNLAQVEGAQIVAVCDLVEELAQQAARETGARPYTNLHAMLEAEELDAVYLSLPAHVHGEPEKAIIERGLPFFVEKPVARHLETAREIEALVRGKGLITCVGYQLRYCGTTDLAQELLTDRTIGLAVGKYWCGSGRGDPAHWVRQWEKSGGQLVEQATHTIDLMRYLVGEIATVYCRQTSRFLSEIDCPDTNCVLFEFANGALGSLTTSWAYEPRDWSHANVIDILYDTSLLHWTAGVLIVTKEGQTTKHRPPGQSIDAVFVEAVRTGDGSAIRSPYSDAVKSLAVSLAANESARQGRPVEVRV